MKRKLSLQELSVKSFITVESQAARLGGMGTDECTDNCIPYTDDCPSNQSSYPGGLSACDP